MDLLRAQVSERDGTWTVERLGKRYTTPLAEAVVKRTCELCNTGWMSDLEDQTKPVLVPLLFAEQPDFEITPESQRILATWAMKTALMADFFYPRFNIMPEWIYSRFFTNRSPPDHQSIIWTAAYKGPVFGLYSLNLPVELTAPVSYNRDGVLERTEGTQIGAVATLRVLRVVFQVLVYPGYGVPMGHPSDGTVIQRIWPLHRKTIPWPPDRLALNDEDFRRFSLRSGTAVSLGPLVPLPL
jgi:hypothetical protein